MTENIRVHDLYNCIEEGAAMRLLALRDLAEAGKHVPSDDWCIDVAADSCTGGAGDAEPERFVCLLRFVPDSEKKCLRCLFLGAEDQYPSGPPGCLGLPTPMKGISNLRFRTAYRDSHPNCRVVSAALSASGPGDPDLVLTPDPDGVEDPDGLLKDVIPEKITFFVRLAYNGLSADEDMRTARDARVPPRACAGPFCDRK